jgi:predicted phosphodiesterase
MKDEVKFLAFGCVHAPLQNDEHIEEIVKWNKDNKPHVVICLGDLFEATAASKWEKEYRVGDRILKQIREVNPDGDYVFLEGNHDANITAKGRLPQDIREMLRYDVPHITSNGACVNKEITSYWTKKANYLYQRDRGSYRLGAVCFAHGMEAGIASDEMQAIYYNQNWANSLFVSSHTHRPTEGKPKQAMKTKGRGLPFWYLNTGCSCDMDKMDYMDRKNRSMWGNGFIHGRCELIKSPRLSKTWDAECVVTKWFE